jgi:hypothetical protein
MLIQELKLTENIALLREVSDDVKLLLLTAADIFLAPCDSLHESFGLTPVEAMACGVPQVVADWNGYRDTVSNGETGFLVPTCWGRCDRELRGTDSLFGWVYDHTLLSQSVVLDVACMQDRLQTLIRKPELRASMSERSRSRAVAEFSGPRVACLYDQLFRELNEISRKLEPYPKSRHFDQIPYFDLFGHFATRELSDHCMIRATTKNSLPLSKVTSLAETELHITVFDLSLFDQIIYELINARTNSEGRSVAQVLSKIVNETRSPEMVRRHILFLLKHGKVELIS